MNSLNGNKLFGTVVKSHHSFLWNLSLELELRVKVDYLKKITCSIAYSLGYDDGEEVASFSWRKPYAKEKNSKIYKSYCIEQSLY